MLNRWNSFIINMQKSLSYTPHQHKQDSIQSLVHECVSRLSEIHRLTMAVSEACTAEQLENTTSLFKTRGEEIQRLSELEKKMSENISEKSAGEYDDIIREYMVTRKGLFEDILELDKALDITVRTMRDKVLAEIKNLSRGKKMHKQYVDRFAMASGFIDIKE